MTSKTNLRKWKGRITEKETKRKRRNVKEEREGKEGL